MGQEFQPSSEKVPDNVSAPAAVESMLHPKDPNSLWPEEVTNNPELVEKARERNELIKNISSVFDRIAPNNLSIQEAIESKRIAPEEATHLYDSLAKLFDSDPESARLALYLPFEIIPQASWKPDSADVGKSAVRFCSIYKSTWQELLDIDDVRANFVDGDVLETELRKEPIERVTKAAHLIPVLAQKGLISLEEISRLATENPGTTLEKSISDALPVLEDLGVVSHEQIEEIQQKISADEPAPKTPLSPEEITEARSHWLEQEKAKEENDISAGKISSAIVQSSLSNQELIEKLTAPDADIKQKLAYIRGIQKAINEMAASDKGRAEIRLNDLKDTLFSINQQSPEVNDALLSLWSHAVRLGIAQEDELKLHGINIPKLDASTSEISNLKSEETAAIDELTSSIETDAELSKFLYPAVILFGSRVKGYGTSSADLDYAIFIKPETPESKRKEIQEKIKEIVGSNISGTAVEFWLEERDGILRIKDFSNPDASQGDSTWTHVLFEGVWKGSRAGIRELHGNLLNQYLYSKDKKIGDRNARSLWLEEMEKDTLQYRLMHKGYDRFYPRTKGVDTKHSDRIDGKSAFYDSGYRRLATKLYAEKVFLPQLDKKK